MSEMKDTRAWVAQTWISFFLAMGTSTIGVAYLPVDWWVRGFIAIAYLFSLAQAFALAKTLRDDHESQKIMSRLKEAKAEKILREFEREAV